MEFQGGHSAWTPRNCLMVALLPVLVVALWLTIGSPGELVGGGGSAGRRPHTSGLYHRRRQQREQDFVQDEDPAAGEATSSTGEASSHRGRDGAVEDEEGGASTSGGAVAPTAVSGLTDVHARMSKTVLSAMDSTARHKKARMRTECQNFLADPLHHHLFGQYHQDWFLYNNFFKDRPAGAGFYVDVGSNDAIQYSNTLFFDLCLGWKGLCIEPNPIYYLGYSQYRTCTTVPHCVFSQRKNLTMEIGHGTYWGARGHIVGEGSTIQNWKLKRHSKMVTVECWTLEEILKANGIDKNTPIDFMDVDIESQEINVMSAFPFEEFNIRLITIESNHIDGKRMNEIMTKGGFVQSPHYTIGPDAIYQNMTARNPQQSYLKPPFKPLP